MKKAVTIIFLAAICFFAYYGMSNSSDISEEKDDATVESSETSDIKSPEQIEAEVLERAKQITFLTTDGTVMNTIEVLNQTVSAELYIPFHEAILMNTSSQNYSLVSIDYTFYDKDDIIIDTSVTTVDNVNAGQKFKAKVAMPKDESITKMAITKIEVY
jgi:hypothetical protein